MICSAKRPALRVRKGETYARAATRFRKAQAEYRDALVMCECEHQATVGRGARHRILFRAFYGVELRYIVEFP